MTTRIIESTAQKSKIVETDDQDCRQSKKEK